MLDNGTAMGHRVSGTENLPHYSPLLPSHLLVFKTSLSWASATAHLGNPPPAISGVNQ